MNGKQGFLTVILVVIAQVIFTITIIGPMWMLVLTDVFINFFDLFPFITNPRRTVAIVYGLLYVLSFIFLYRNKTLSRRASYSIFAMLQYFLLSCGIYCVMATNDGQSIFLLYLYCVMAIVISRVWVIFWIKSDAEKSPSELGSELP
jgi:hypothetical protein